MVVFQLCGLLPNIGGTGVKVHRLNEGVVRSRILYRAPVWAGDLMASRRSLLLPKMLRRTAAFRIIRASTSVPGDVFSVRAPGLGAPTSVRKLEQDVRGEARRDVW